jgi:hypothetical protein
LTHSTLPPSAGSPESDKAFLTDTRFAIIGRRHAVAAAEKSRQHACTVRESAQVRGNDVELGGNVFSELADSADDHDSN